MCRIAETFSCTQPMAYGKLATSTTIVFALAAFTLRIRLSCAGSRAIDLRSTASLPSLGVGHKPNRALHVGWLPTNTMATSDSAARLDALPLLSSGA